MKISYLVIGAMLFTSNAYSYTSKVCRDGVCKITEGEKVRWEGPKDKVAKIKKAEAQKQKKIDQMLSKIAKLPRKQVKEKIRIALFNSYSSSSMKKYAPQYFKKIMGLLKKNKNIEVITEKQFDKEVEQAAIRMAMNSDWSKNDPSSDFDKARKPGDYVPLSEKVKEAQLLGVPVDAVVQLGFSVHLKQGLVGGKGGAGVAEVDYPELSAKVTSIYKFKPVNKKFHGKSTTKFAVAGINKKGKASAGQLKGAKRNLSKDEGALNSLTGFIVNNVNKSRKTMPTIASLDKFHKRAPASASIVPKKISKKISKKKLKKSLKGLFK